MSGIAIGGRSGFEIPIDAIAEEFWKVLPQKVIVL